MLKIYENTIGKNNADYAQCVNDLGELYEELNML